MDTKSSRSHAFSLLELLVAMAITLLLVVLLAQIVGSVSFAWKSGNSNAERRQNGRALTDFIAQELRAAILPLGGSSAGQTNLQFILNPDAVTAANRNPSALFWQAPMARNSTAGDLAEYGYFVRWSTGNPPRASLCRFMVDSDDTNNWYQIYSNQTWVDDNLLAQAAPADSASGYLGLFAENVVGFWTRCLDKNGVELKPAGGQYDSRTESALPFSVEVSLVLLDERTAGLMNASLQSQLSGLVNSATNAADCIAQIQSAAGLGVFAKGARAYTTRVFLENAR
ncbi:MAG: prepilin-type N-terminal cleavage/methylation domain-containing protein [Terrimicrobiaceae bacterium]